MSVVDEIAAAIKRNPKINRVIVSQREYEQIEDEFKEMQMVKPGPRPTYGLPFGPVDRLLWDEAERLHKLANIRIMGRAVTHRAPGQEVLKR